MRFSVQTNSHTWRLSDMESFHIALLRQAATDATLGRTGDGRKRLHPRPLEESESFLEEEFLTDWDEFVSEDLEEKFSGDLKVFLEDLANAQKQDSDPEDPSDPENPILYFLSLPMEHGAQWFSTLNQARLMMDQHWKFHNENDQFVPHLTPAALGGLDPTERFEAYMRYEFYCMLQEWLVRHVL